MPKFFPQVFITGVVLFLLLGAGYGLTTIQARSIPWDCSDWQAFAHDDRTTAILESLAENRGKTLYCGIDQSDTFTKAETWQAGKDRNERDDTVYFGERGSFRGFIAAQEGYLTDGESGITGISIDRIFEFPREKKKRRRKKEPKLDLVYGQAYPESTLEYRRFLADGGNAQSGPRTGYLIIGTGQGSTHINGNRINTPADDANAYIRAYGPNGGSASTRSAAQTNARTAYEVTDAQIVNWIRNGNGEDPNERTVRGSFEVDSATAECRALGYRRPTRIRWWYLANDSGVPYTLTRVVVNTSPYVYRAYRIVLYEVRCVGRYTPPSGG